MESDTSSSTKSFCSGSEGSGGSRRSAITAANATEAPPAAFLRRSRSNTSLARDGAPPLSGRRLARAPSPTSSVSPQSSRRRGRRSPSNNSVSSTRSGSPRIGTKRSGGSGHSRRPGSSAHLRSSRHARTAGSAPVGGEGRMSHSERASSSHSRSSEALIHRSSTTPNTISGGNRPSLSNIARSSTVQVGSVTSGTSNNSGTAGLDGGDDTTTSALRTATSLGFASYTAAPRTALGGQFMEDSLEDDAVPSLGSNKRQMSLMQLQQKQQQQRQPRKRSFMRRVLSDDSTASGQSASSFTYLASFFSKSGRAVSLMESSQESVAYEVSDSRDSGLGSTILADREKRYRQEVDQSVNLMDHSGDPEYAPKDKTLGSSAHSVCSVPRKGARNKQTMKKRDSVMHIMFGGGHNAKITKKSMKDVCLGPDPTTKKLAMLKSQRDQLDKEQERKDCLENVKKYAMPLLLCSLAIIAIALLPLILAAFHFNDNPTKDSANGTNAIPGPTPVVSSLAPTLTPPSMEESPAIPLETVSVLQNGSTSLEEEQGTTGAAKDEAMANATASVALSNDGVPAQSTTKKSTKPKVLGLNQLGVVEEPTSETINSAGLEVPQEPAAVKTELEAWIVQSNLTSLQDMKTEQSSAYRALEWIQNTSGMAPSDLVADSNQKLQVYCVAVFYFATHPIPANQRSSAKTKEDKKSPEEVGHTSLRRGRTLIASDRRSCAESEDGTEWMLDSSICDWKGIRCNRDTNMVTHIKMPGAKLHGTIPSEIRGLKELLELDLGHNHLHGSIPPAIGELTNLTYIDLKRNNITGVLPESLGYLESLREINVEGNRIRGTIPFSLHGMTDMLYLVLSKNRLQGSIPPFNNFTKLKLLDLDSNDLTGTVPFDSLSLLEKLEEFRAEHNHLTGSIAPSIADFASIQAVTLKDNRIGGSLPDGFTSHETLVELDLSENALHGTLPPSIGVLTELKHLKLHTNDITGSIPAVWFGMAALESLIMHHNKLEGSIPPVLSDMLELQDLRLNHNRLTGSIPTELNSLSNMKHLHLESNLLSGEIPLLEGIETLLLYHNNITGNTSTICSSEIASSLEKFVIDCLYEEYCDCCTDCH